MKNDFDKKCNTLTIAQLKKLPEYKQIPKEINKSELSKKSLCKLLKIIHASNREGSSSQFFDLVKSLSLKNKTTNKIGGKSLQKSRPSPRLFKPKECNVPQLAKKYIRVIKPTRRLYHGRSISKNADVWESSKDLRKIMWWALEKITPLMYASTSIKGRSLDSFYRWDVYEARVKQHMPFLLMNKQSIQYFINTPEISELKCEGKTVGKWLKKAFPIKNGRLKRRSHIDSDRKMAICLCTNLSCVGYIADEIAVVEGPGKLHKEIMVCVPEETLVLKKYMGFSSKRGQRSVERYLNETTTKLLPDSIKKY